MKNTIKASSGTTASAFATSLVAFALVAGAGSARAAQSSPLLTRTVSYADLNLDTESGARVLYARLHNAAKNVCSQYESRELSRKRVWSACVSSALTSAAEQINKPMLSALIGPNAGGFTG